MSKSLNADHEYKATLEDNFLKHIGYEHVENLCDELESQKENWKDIDVSESLNRWFGDFLKQERKRRNKGNRRSSLLKFAKRAAIFLLFLIGINFLLITNVSAYRIHFLNTIISIQEKFTQIDYSSDETDYSVNIPENWSGLYYLTYLPQGYKLTDSSPEIFRATIVFTDDEGNHITLLQHSVQSSQQIDSEGGKAKKVLVNEEEAYLTEKDGLKIISWLQYDKTFYLEANNIDVNEMIKIAEGIEIEKK